MDATQNMCWHGQMTWSPTRANPVFILAMDHRASFGATLFGVKDDRPAPDHWIEVAAPREGFVGFAIGRSIWEDTIREYLAGTTGRAAARTQIAHRYLHFVRRWTAASS